ncbi:MAG: photosynthetic complex putative assembly protein PuhB [Pseudomonadota bacterium]
MSHDDYQFEPLPGLPSHLPEGEEILWQGRPSVFGFAQDVLRIHWVVGYFLFLIVWRAISNSDQGIAPVLQNTVPLVVLGLAACGVILVIAWILAATTVYTITNKRIVIRKGAALSFALNLPFAQMVSADLSMKRSGRGTIALTMSEPLGMSYLVLWPHVRPWKMAEVRPSLRSIKDARAISDILADAAVSFTREVPDATVEPRGAHAFPAE